MGSGDRTFGVFERMSGCGSKWVPARRRVPAGPGGTNESAEGPTKSIRRTGIHLRYTPWMRKWMPPCKGYWLNRVLSMSHTYIRPARPRNCCAVGLGSWISATFPPPRAKTRSRSRRRR